MFFRPFFLPPHSNHNCLLQSDLGDNDEGQSHKVKCDDDYDCNGDDTVTCHNGQWDKAPSCSMLFFFLFLFFFFDPHVGLE